MARPRSDNRDKAFEIYKQHDGKITNRAIAEQLGINEKTIGGWKCKDKWDDELNGVLQTKIRSTPNKKNKRGAPIGNQNAKGNKGGEGGPVGNDHATKHGFFKQIFPDDEDTLAIIEEIQIKSPLEILWEQIVIQYTAIARAQRLMFVENKEDITEHLKRKKRSSGIHSDSWEDEWELQFAWDKHASFLTAQSRAIKTLEQLIARYEQMLVKELDLEEQQLRIETLKAQLEKIKDPAMNEIQVRIIDDLGSDVGE